MAAAREHRSEVNLPRVRATGTASTQRTARVAGLLYLAVLLSLPLATSVRSLLVVPGDATMTAQNVVANETLFRLTVTAEAAIVLIDIALAAILYVLLRPVSPALSLAAAFSRVSASVVIAASSLFTGLLTLRVAGNARSPAAVGPEQRDVLALLFQEGNDVVVLWGVVFALHLMLVGGLAYRSGFLPRASGVLLLLAGGAYLARSFGALVTPGHSELVSLAVLVLAVPAELTFALWLLFRGIDEERWHLRAVGTNATRR